MAWKRTFQGSLLAFIGFMLSPLSWWNDAFVNLPLALGFGWLVARIYQPAFEPSVVLGYWLTNVLGFVLMHKGAQKIASAGFKPYTRRRFVIDVGVSVLYTLLIIVLLRLNVLQPLENYFPEK